MAVYKPLSLADTANKATRYVGQNVTNALNQQKVDENQRILDDQNLLRSVAGESLGEGGMLDPNLFAQNLTAGGRPLMGLEAQQKHEQYQQGNSLQNMEMLKARVGLLKDLVPGIGDQASLDQARGLITQVLGEGYGDLLPPVYNKETAGFIRTLAGNIQTTWEQFQFQGVNMQRSSLGELRAIPGVTPTRPGGTGTGRAGKGEHLLPDNSSISNPEILAEWKAVKVDPPENLTDEQLAEWKKANPQQSLRDYREERVTGLTKNQRLLARQMSLPQDVVRGWGRGEYVLIPSATEGGKGMLVKRSEATNALAGAGAAAPGAAAPGAATGEAANAPAGDGPLVSTPPSGVATASERADLSNPGFGQIPVTGVVAGAVGDASAAVNNAIAMESRSGEGQREARLEEGKQNALAASLMESVEIHGRELDQVALQEERGRGRAASTERAGVPGQAGIEGRLDALEKVIMEYVRHAGRGLQGAPAARAKRAAASALDIIRRIDPERAKRIQDNVSTYATGRNLGGR